jgi:hypothetical protein
MGAGLRHAGLPVVALCRYAGMTVRAAAGSAGALAPVRG